MSVSDLPAVNASLNGIASVLLMVGIIAIKRENKILHGYCMGSAFIVSCVFLITYVTHKILVAGVHTKFGGDGAWRGVYFFILVTHVVLAMAVPPLAIITIRHARAGRFEAHKRIARYTFPIWMYVSVTGVLVYFMLYVWFPTVAM